MASIDIEDIRLRLQGEPRLRFLKIKKQLGLEQDTEVLRFLVSNYFVSKMVISAEFLEWFVRQPHPSIIELNEVIDAYVRFERERKREE